MTKTKRMILELQALAFIGATRRAPSPVSLHPVERLCGKAFANARGRGDLAFIRAAKLLGYQPWKGMHRRTSMDALGFFQQHGRRPSKNSLNREERRLGEAWSARVCRTHVLHDPKFVRAVKSLGAL